MIASSTRRERPLKDLVEILTGLQSAGVRKSRDPGSETGPTYRLINTRHLDDFGQLSVEQFDQVRVHETTKVERHQVRPGDVLLVCRGPSLRTALVTEPVSGAITSSNLLILRSRGEILPQALLAWLRTPSGQSELSSRQHSSTVSLLRVKDVESVAVPIPSSLVQQQIAALIECADDGYRAGIRAAGLRRRIAYEAIEKTLLS